jgi:LysM repeat protein
MKRIFILLFALGVAASLHAQDAAVEERLNKLSGQVEDLLAAQAVQQKRLAELAKELADLREQQNHPNTAYATAEDLKRLAEKIQELDGKREADKELILREIEKLGKTAVVAKPVVAAASQPAGNDNGYEYVIQPNDTLSAIVKAYRQKKIKVTVDQILKANPGLDPKHLQLGQKIFIPAPSK